jgi:APA family basic amino acid/polyamine antiporter
MSDLFLKKSIARLIADAENPMSGGGHGGHGGGSGGLARTLGPVSITMLGIGAIIGAGIFTLTGEAASAHAGPGIIYSFIVAGILCTLAGLCYAEMAAMIPVSGSDYAYAYATMGEGIAWIIGWALTLEYALGAGVVANGWSGYTLSLISRTIGIHIPDALLCYTKGPWELVTLSNGERVFGIVNLPAAFITILLACVLYRGITQSTKFNTIMVIVKMLIVALFITLGLGVVSWANLQANPEAGSFFTSLVPLAENFIDPVTSVESVRYGWLNGGVLTGAGLVFYAYIGFDAVSTVAQEAKNPKRDIPIGILASLLICTVLYILMGITLTGVVPFRELGTSDPIALGIDKIAILRGWSHATTIFITSLVKVGAITGLTTVVLVLSLSQTRVWYAISRDGLLPWFGTLHPKYNTPHIATVFTGIIATLCGAFVPIGLLAKVISLGTMMIFLLVCLSVPIMRWTDPDAERPFKVPFAWVTSLAGAGSCAWVMSGLGVDIWIKLIIFLVVGLGIYFIYGRRNSVQQKENGAIFGPVWIDYVGFAILVVGLTMVIKALSLMSIIIGIIGITIGLVMIIKNCSHK